MDLAGILNLLIVISFLLIIILTIFIAFSVLWSNVIIKRRIKRIKEKRKEILKIALQDVSLYVQLAITFGVALLLYSLSLKDITMLSWGLFGMVGIATGIFLLFWRYLPLKNKLMEQYKWPAPEER